MASSAKGDVRWVRQADVLVTANMRSMAQQHMKTHIIRMLCTWDTAPTVVFGGSIRRAILSEYTIQKDKELLHRLSDGTYSQYVLSNDHFIPLDTDLDVYIQARPDQTQSCVQSLMDHMTTHLRGYNVCLRTREDGYPCARLRISTFPHPLAPVIHVDLDVVVEGTKCGLYPDFTPNQLCVSTSALTVGELSLFRHDRAGDPWWSSNYDVERCLEFTRPYNRSILGGSMNLDRQIVEVIKAQIQNKVGHVLLYSFRRWSCVQQRTGQPFDLKTYTQYVAKIVGYRLLKLLSDGFEIVGFKPHVVDLNFVCEEQGFATPIESLQIESTSDRTTLLRGNDPDDDDDDCSSSCEENPEAVSSYYWCVGCSAWHSLVDFVL